MAQKKFYKNIIFLLIAASLVAFIGCKKADEAPMGPTDFSIDLTDARYNDLRTSGGWLYFTSGYNGVVVFNYNGTFIAFERACPIDNSEQVEVDDSNITLTCPKCHSRFIYTDGSPFEGEAKSPLRQYVTRYDENRQQVYVTSF